ncbi:hypothetical protein NQ317_011506 [Molorchus minor]|uniref:Uncharacterized protein n=1 Tax=Molorchus minor TaxID=1323400 RepID=A0ABQ9JA01_9CUCU|nr:hypothetical protein NQ317_011506 [Molorchus minor]
MSKPSRAEKFTGHAFRRTSATIVPDSGMSLDELKWQVRWNYSTVAAVYVESTKNKLSVSRRIVGAVNRSTTSTSPTLSAYRTRDGQDPLATIENQRMTVMLIKYEKYEKSDRIGGYSDKDRYEEKKERKDKYEKDDKYKDRDDKYSRDERDRYKKSKHRDEEKEEIKGQAKIK